MNDLISREAAISAIYACHSMGSAIKDFVKYGYTDAFTQGILDAVSAIDNLPSDQPDRKRGRWVHHDGGYSDHYECTACGEAIVLTGMWNFCPNCGADMRREEDG